MNSMFLRINNFTSFNFRSASLNIALRVNNSTFSLHSMMFSIPKNDLKNDSDKCIQRITIACNPYLDLTLN